MVKKADIPKHVIDSAMRLAAEQGWRDLSLAEIAQAAELPLSKVYPLFSSKAAILRGLSRQVDAAVLADEELEELEGNARDRIFDVLMRRFDYLQPYKEAIGNIALDQSFDPLSACATAVTLRRSMALMLEAAGLSTGGLRGLLRVKGLMAIYLATLRVWLRDESADMAKTMAALDGYLRRVEGFAERRPFRRRGSATGADGAESPESASG